MRNWIKLCIIGLFLGLGLRIKTVKGEVSTITQPDEILVWFVEVDDFGNPIWKDVDGDPTNNDCVIYAICIFKPLYRGGLPNPEAIPFESDYLPVVVGEEIGNVNIEAVKAQAVAARSYALYNMNNVPSYCTDSCHVTQSTSHQYYNPDRTTSKSILGVTETNKEYLVYPENSAIMPIQTEFSRDHYGLFTKYGGTEYLSSIYDPITTGDDGYSHGRGMSQLGAMKWADGDNWYGVSFPRWSYRRILAHYYTKTQMISAQGNNVWGLYRWNLLQTFPSSGASLKAGKEQSIEIHAQNTGYSTWPSNLEMRIKWYRYDTYLQYDGETGWTVGTLPYNDTTLSPGVHMSLTPVFTPPDSIYWGKNSRYTYCAELDMYIPSTGQRMQEQSWETQYWCNFTLSRPIISPPKKDKPTPASAPPCNTRNCPTPLSTQPITWNRTNHIDPIRYVWRQTDAHGGQIDTDNLQQPLLGDPILTPDELELGENKFYVYSIETTDVENTSDEILVATVHFDPDAPVVTMTGPTWIKPGQTINITAPIDDTALSSGLQAYTQTTQLNTNPGAVNVTTGDPYTFNATAVFNESVPQNAQHNDTYTFKLDVQDYALNTTSLHHSVKVDAQAPTLVTSEHPIWTNQTSPSFKWKVHDEGIGIQSVTIEQRPAGGTWSALHTYPVNALNDYEGIVTLTALQDESIYEIRYTMTDALDNQSTDIKTIKTDFTPPTATIPDISDPGDTVIYIPEGWTDIALTGNDPPRTSGKPTSGIMYYELRYGLPARINGNKTTDRGSVETPILPPWIGSTVIAYRHPPYVHFNGPNTGQYVFSLRAYDWAGNRSAWSEPTLPYQFGTDDTGYYSDTYTESYLPFFRPKRVPLPTAPPDRETVQQRGVDTPYPLPENEIKE